MMKDNRITYDDDAEPLKNSVLLLVHITIHTVLDTLAMPILVIYKI